MSDTTNKDALNRPTIRFDMPAPSIDLNPASLHRVCSGGYPHDPDVKPVPEIER
jgi:hypothetical protein